MSSVQKVNLKVPNSRPNMLNVKPQMVIDTFNIDRKKYPVVLLGIRGYYLNTLGKKGMNDRNMYDDAIFVDIRLPYRSVCYTFNGNTDPSSVRQGIGNESEKGMFVLDSGVYYAHKIGRHNGKYTALVQWDKGEKRYSKLNNEGKVKGHRDGGEKENKPYPVDWGHYSINIHKGGEGRKEWTWSEGCQTIPKSQWNEFINLIRSEMKNIFKEGYVNKTIPYCLINNAEHKHILSNPKSTSLATTVKKIAATATMKIVLAEAKKAAQEAATAEKKAAKAASEAKKAASEAAASARKAEKAAATAKKLVEEAKKKAAKAKKNN